MISGGEMSPGTFFSLRISTALLSVCHSGVARNVWRHFGCGDTVIFAHAKSKVSNLLLFMLTFTCENHTVRLKGNDCVWLRLGEL